ncbi:RNA-binding protein 4 [Pseudolycoriella hygida]|uniref:RNA-binding protein 4 n=1 Tax=Pseudolycoriella hygida TaxID=35572 RepID=A0A9Q0N011_9DIPT|nr:RNA-binding protein 4 [Pseudolycoriella hygida]
MVPNTKVFVGSLPPSVKPEDLRRLFENFGVVTECDIMNRCGFVHMENAEMAENAIRSLNNTSFKGITISVEPGRMKERGGGGKARAGGAGGRGGGGGGGGFGRGGGGGGGGGGGMRSGQRDNFMRGGGGGLRNNNGGGQRSGPYNRNGGGNMGNGGGFNNRNNGNGQFGNKGGFGGQDRFDNNGSGMNDSMGGGGGNRRFNNNGGGGNFGNQDRRGEEVKEVVVEQLETPDVGSCVMGQRNFVKRITFELVQVEELQRFGLDGTKQLYRRNQDSDGTRSTRREGAKSKSDLLMRDLEELTEEIV